VLPACRSFGSRQSGNSWQVGAAGRACSRAYVIHSGRKRASASTPNLGNETAMFWSASSLPELWIASEREHVASVPQPYALPNSSARSVAARTAPITAERIPSSSSTSRPAIVVPPGLVT